MERLTQRVGNEIYVECGDKVDITEKGIIDLLKTKLAAYEDAEEQGRLVILPEPTPDIDFVRIFNLVMADAEDRVIVLPCKVWDTVWGADPDGPYCFKFEIRHYPHIGKDIFLTREEAEKALEGMNNG